MVANVWPPRNVPGPAIPWSRDIEARVDALLHYTDNVSNSDARATAGVLAVTANSIVELQARRSVTVVAPDLIATATVTTTNSVPFSVTQTVTIPCPDTHRRKVILFAGGGFDADEATVTGGSGALVIRYQGRDLTYYGDAFGAGPSRPVWNGAGSNFEAFETFGESELEFTLTFSGTMASFGSGSPRNIWVSAYHTTLTCEFGERVD